MFLLRRELRMVKGDKRDGRRRSGVRLAINSSGWWMGMVFWRQE